MRVTHEQIPNTIKFLQIDFPALVLQTAGIEENDEYWQQVTEQIQIICYWLMRTISKKCLKERRG